MHGIHVHTYIRIGQHSIRHKSGCVCECASVHVLYEFCGKLLQDYVDYRRQALSNHFRWFVQFKSERFNSKRKPAIQIILKLFSVKYIALVLLFLDWNFIAFTQPHIKHSAMTVTTDTHRQRKPTRYDSMKFPKLYRDKRNFMKLIEEKDTQIKYGEWIDCWSAMWMNVHS